MWDDSIDRDDYRQSYSPLLLKDDTIDSVVDRLNLSIIAQCGLELLELIDILVAFAIVYRFARVRWCSLGFAELVVKLD